MNENNSRRVAILKEIINSAEAEIIAIENGITDANTTILRREVMNLLDGVGRGYIEGDYYAPSRYYSDIIGVKNIRINSYHWKDDEVCVKLLSPIGRNIPTSITVRGKNYRVVTCNSDRYSEEVDY